MISISKIFEKSPDARTELIRQSYIYTFIIKAVSIGANLLIIPLTIDYVNSERYGIWLTISSIIIWFGLLDLGFGNGLRNRLGEAIVAEDIPLQRKLIQTTLVALIFISTLIITIYLLLFYNLNWDELLGVSVTYRAELKQLSLVLVILFCLQFILQILNPIYFALQKPNMISLFLFTGNLFGLVGVLILKYNSEPSLLKLGLVVMGGNVLALLLFFIHYFTIVRKDLFKNFRMPEFADFKLIFSLGLKFFVLNIAYVVQFQTSNILISRFLSAQHVTEFNVAFKLFSVITFMFGIVVTPVWSSVTNALASSDYNWIYGLIKRMMKFWGLACLAIIVLVGLSPFIYKIWIGDKVHVPFITTLGVAMMVCSTCFSSIFTSVLNGMSKVNVQFFLAIGVTLAFIPIAYFFSITLAMGVFGICLAIVVANVGGLIIAPIQVFKALRNPKSLLTK